MNGGTVLVTGGTGFLAARCIVQALQAGHPVRTTVRSPEKERRVRAAVAAAGVPEDAPLTVTVADLLRDDGWAGAVAGCAYVLHLASPLPAGRPARGDDLVVPAREGTLRVLRAARDAGVRRTVVTSSFAAIGYGHPPTDRPFTEEDWTDLSGGVAPYVVSKTLAERAAWDFMAREGGGMTLSVVNPVAVLGPPLGPEMSASVGAVRALLDGALPGTPRIAFAVVDSRDAADLHLRAMTGPAAGERFIAASGDVWSLHRMARVLRRRLGPAADRVPTRVLPDWLVRAAALVRPGLRDVAADLGNVRHLDGGKARRVLGWEPRPGEDTLADTARGLLDRGLLKSRHG